MQQQFTADEIRGAAANVSSPRVRAMLEQAERLTRNADIRHDACPAVHRSGLRCEVEGVGHAGPHEALRGAADRVAWFDLATAGQGRQRPLVTMTEAQFEVVRSIDFNNRLQVGEHFVAIIRELHAQRWGQP